MPETPLRTSFPHSHPPEEAVEMTELEKAFAEFVKKKSKFAKDGLGRDVEYIPSTALKEFWQIDRMRDLLASLEIKEHPEQIIDHFIRIFSILVYIGNTRDIGLFTPHKLDDHSLPFTSRPTRWAGNPPNNDLFAKFSEHQWRFCPLEFCGGYMHKRHLEPEIILPVKYETQLGQKSGGGEDSIVFKVQVNGDCNETLPSTTVVFKVYQTDEAKDFYKAEADTYTSFPDEYKEYIAKCYGSFEQNGKYIIILEYAPMGTLLDFWRKTRCPSNTKELTNFWRALLQLLQGLKFIHEMSAPNKISGWVWTVTHHDIKPANILVFSNEPQGSGPYDVKFKLADFGTTHIAKKLAGAEHTPTIANSGNRMYTAPECCPSCPVQDIVPIRVDPSVDVWALGAVFSETLIWTVWGEEGRERYRLQRKKEIAQIEALSGTGYDACFHNGRDRLAVVEAMHDSALEHVRKNDTVSEIVSELILTHMLKAKQRGRLDPISTLLTAQDRLRKRQEPRKTTEPPPIGTDLLLTDRHPGYINDGNAKFGPTGHNVPGRPNHNHSESQPLNMPGMRTVDSSDSRYEPSQQTPGASHHTRSASLPVESNPESDTANGDATWGVGLGRTRPIGRGISSNSSSTERKVTFKEVYDLLMRKNNRSTRLGRMVSSRRGPSAEVMVLPGIQEALSKISALGRREQLILIDDFDSMKAHKVEVQVAARVISYYVKEVDPNKMELYFASKSIKPSKHETSSGLEAAIRGHEFVPGVCAMNLYLRNILDTMTSSKSGGKPFSVYVFTDAVWEPGEPGVDRVIAEAARKLAEMGLPAEHIMIQFIRFGDGEAERKRLRKLDDNLVEDFKLEKDYDIVDTKSYDDSVPDILIGSISKFNDLKNS